MQFKVIFIPHDLLVNELHKGVHILLNKLNASTYASFSKASIQAISLIHLEENSKEITCLVCHKLKSMSLQMLAFTNISE